MTCPWAPMVGGTTAQSGQRNDGVMAPKTQRLHQRLGHINRTLPAPSSAPVSTMPMLYSSVPPQLTLPNSNGSRTRWRVSSLVNTDWLEHPNLLLLFIGWQSSGELISRLLQFPTNSSWPINLPTWPTQYLNMFLVAYWGQLVRVHCPSLTQKQSSRAFWSATLSIWNRLQADIRNLSSLSIFRSILKTHFFRLAFE